MTPPPTLCSGASYSHNFAPGGGIDQCPQIAFPICCVHQEGVGHGFRQVGNDLVTLDPAGAFFDAGPGRARAFGFRAYIYALSAPSAIPASVTAKVGCPYNPYQASQLGRPGLAILGCVVKSISVVS